MEVARVEERAVLIVLQRNERVAPTELKVH